MAPDGFKEGWHLIPYLCIAISIVEYIFAYHDVRIGIILALSTTIGAYILLSVKEMSVEVSDSVESLSLIPIYILFTSSLPWFFLSRELLLPAVYSAIIGLCFHHIHSKKISIEELGLKKHNLLKYALLGLTGIPMGFVEYFILKPAPASPTFMLGNFFRDLAYMVLFVGVGEELLFRGLIQRSLTRALSPKAGLILGAYIFSVMHLTWRSVPELIFVFFAGILFGYLYQRTGSLTAPIVSHGVGNLLLVGVFPYLLR